MSTMCLCFSLLANSLVVGYKTVEPKIDARTMHSGYTIAIRYGECRNYVREKFVINHNLHN